MKSLAEFDRRVIHSHRGAYGKQVQVIATSAAFEAVIHLPFQIDGKRPAVARLGPMDRTGPAEDIAHTYRRSITDQFQNLGHGDHVTNSPKIDTWHVSTPTLQQRAGTEKRNPHVFASETYTLPGMSAPRPSIQPAEQRRGTRMSSRAQAQQHPAYGTEKRNPYVFASDTYKAHVHIVIACILSACSWPTCAQLSCRPATGSISLSANLELPAGNRFNFFVGQLGVARRQRDTIPHKSTQCHLLNHTQLRRKRFQKIRERILNTANDRTRKFRGRHRLPSATVIAGQQTGLVANRH